MGYRQFKPSSRRPEPPFRARPRRHPVVDLPRQVVAVGNVGEFLLMAEAILAPFVYWRGEVVAAEVESKELGNAA